VETTYIEDSLFPIAVWNQYRPEGPRTNNHIEGYNSKLNRFISTHPNIWLFIEKMKNEETLMKMNYLKIVNNGKVRGRGRGKKALATDLAISAANCEFLENRDLIEFAKALVKAVPDFQ
jgi:hypothetical protein